MAEASTMAIQLTLGQFVTQGYLGGLTEEGFDVSIVPDFHVLPDAHGRRQRWWKLGRQYASNVLYALDVLWHALSFGDGRETWSSHIAKDAAAGKKVAGLICRLLNLADDGHCQRSLHKELGGRALWQRSWPTYAAGLGWLVLAVFVLPAWFFWATAAGLVLLLWRA